MTHTIQAGNTYYDRRYQQYFTLENPIPPPPDKDWSSEQYQYLLDEWSKDNENRFIARYDSGKIDFMFINWIEHHINGKQYLPKIF
jgi:hypothetical protein